MNDCIRIGRISSVNYETGMVRVLYRDRDDSVTKELPLLNMNGEYKLPKVDDLVLVLHLSNGSSMGIVLGTFWSDVNQPAETGKGIYRKELGEIIGEAFIRYDTSTKTISIKADHVKIQTADNTIDY